MSKKEPGEEDVYSILYRILKKLNYIEERVDQAAQGYYREKKKSAGIMGKMRALQEELGFEKDKQFKEYVSRPRKQLLPGDPIELGMGKWSKTPEEMGEDLEKDVLEVEDEEGDSQEGEEETKT